MNLSRKNEAGFSLVELAIALVVIGLLLAGLLKSTEIIENARVNTVVSQVGHYESAITSFKTMYGALPGDMRDPERVTACGGYCAVAGNADGMIFDQPSADYQGGQLTGESRRVWIQLAKAGLIQSIDTENDGSAPPKNGVDYPGVPFQGGVYDIHFSRNTGTTRPLRTPAHYLKTRILPMTTNANNVLQAQQAYKIDMKMDDGFPTTGRVIAWRWDSATLSYCGNETDNKYTLTNRAMKCDVSIQMNF